ncbi:MAG: hypothetical protein ACFFBP_14410 [Promethearchaeota archaeon]
MKKNQQSETFPFKQDDAHKELPIFEKIKVEDILFKIPVKSKKL